MRKLLALLAAVALVLAGTVLPASADSDARPFKGSLEGSVTFVPFTPGCSNYGGFNLSTVSAASGQVSHMGRTTMTAVHCTPDEGVTAVTGGEMTLVAANGDAVYITYEGSAPLPGPDPVIVVDLEFDVIGGTGRFVDADGGGHMNAYVVFEGFDDFEWAASWTWNGTIGY